MLPLLHRYRPSSPADSTSAGILLPIIPKYIPSGLEDSQVLNLTNGSSVLVWKDDFKVQIAVSKTVFTMKPVVEDKEVLLTISKNKIKMDGTVLDSRHIDTFVSGSTLESIVKRKSGKTLHHLLTHSTGQVDVNKLMILTCQQGADSCLDTIMAGRQDRRGYVNQVVGAYATPLQIASINGRNTTVRRLVEDYGANVSGDTGGSSLTPLCAAADGGHLSTVRILIQLGAKPGECTSVNKYWYPHLINPGNEHDEIKKYLAMLNN